MKYRKRIYYTDWDKELMWDRYCEGDSLPLERLLRSAGSIDVNDNSVAEVARSRVFPLRSITRHVADRHSARPDPH